MILDVGMFCIVLEELLNVIVGVDIFVVEVLVVIGFVVSLFEVR